MINYEGLFFEGENLEKILSLEETKLDTINDIIHCTFKYKPSYEETFDELVGKYYDVDLLGYGCDGKNSGFMIAFQDELKDYYINCDEDGNYISSHITTSIKEGEEAINTKDIDFKFYNKPIHIKGRFGYYIKDENGKAYVSYKPFKTKK